MLKREELYKSVRIEIIQKNLGRLEAWTWENKKIQISKMWTIASANPFYSVEMREGRSRAKAGDTDGAQ